MPKDLLGSSSACVWHCFDVSENREGRKNRTERVFKKSIKRKKYAVFRFTFLSKLSNELIRFLLGIRYGKEVLCLKVKSDEISIHCFPKDETKKQKWIKVKANANLRISKDTVVCRLQMAIIFWRNKSQWKILIRRSPIAMARCTIYSNNDIITTTTIHNKTLFKHTQHWGRSIICFSVVMFLL